MAQLLLNANGTTLSMPKKLSALVGSQENYDTCKFVFNDEWEGFEKIAVFYTDAKEKVLVRLDENGVCVFPKEAVAGYGILFIGVCGTKDDIVLPTNYVSHILIEGANPYAESGGDDEKVRIPIYNSVEDLPDVGAKGDVAIVLNELENGTPYATLYVWTTEWVIVEDLLTMHTHANLGILNLFSLSDENKLLWNDMPIGSTTINVYDDVSDLPTPDEETLAFVKQGVYDDSEEEFSKNQAVAQLYVNPMPSLPCCFGILDYSGILFQADGTSTDEPVPYFRIIGTEVGVEYTYSWVDVQYTVGGFDYDLKKGWNKCTQSGGSVTCETIKYSELPDLEGVEITAFSGEIGKFVHSTPFTVADEKCDLYLFNGLEWVSLGGIDELIPFAHTHKNKTTLDKIKEQDLTDLASNTLARHTHTNKTDVLDKLSTVNNKLLFNGQEISSDFDIPLVYDLSDLPESGTLAILAEAKGEEVFIDGEYSKIYISPIPKKMSNAPETFRSCKICKGVGGVGYPYISFNYGIVIDDNNKSVWAIDVLFPDPAKAYTFSSSDCYILPITFPQGWSTGSEPPQAVTDLSFLEVDTTGTPFLDGGEPTVSEETKVWFSPTPFTITYSLYYFDPTVQEWVLVGDVPSADISVDFYDSKEELPESGSLAFIREQSPLFDPYEFEKGQTFDKLYLNPNPITPWEWAYLEFKDNKGFLCVTDKSVMNLPIVNLHYDDGEWVYVCGPFNGVVKINDEIWRINTPAGWVEVTWDEPNKKITGIPIDFSEIPELTDIEIVNLNGDIGYFISPYPYPQHNNSATLYAYDEEIEEWRSVEEFDNLYKLVIGNTNARHTHPNPHALNSIYELDGDYYIGTHKIDWDIHSQSVTGNGNKTVDLDKGTRVLLTVSANSTIAFSSSKYVNFSVEVDNTAKKTLAFTGKKMQGVAPRPLTDKYIVYGDCDDEGNARIMGIIECYDCEEDEE